MLKNSQLREKIFRQMLYAGDILKRIAVRLALVLNISVSFTIIIFLLLFTYFIGFDHGENEIRLMKLAFRVILWILFTSKLFLVLISRHRFRMNMAFVFRTLVLVYAFVVLLLSSGMISLSGSISGFLSSDSSVITACFVLVLLEISRLFNLVSSFNFPPALVFASSFLIIILIGTALLMLPNSRTEPITLIDGLFTSVSSVCVTGLTVVSTSDSFTLMGKIIILVLIQTGGLGMMTFTGFFSYVFTSTSTLQERMLLKDMFSAESMGNLYRILTKIILFTLLSEGAGAVAIFVSLDPESAERTFVSVFHSVSAFCNAGFSTFPDGLSQAGISNNYSLLSVIMTLVVIGGLGFPVILRLYSITRSRIVRSVKRLRGINLFSRNEVFDSGSKIALMTTLILLLFGGTVFFLLESNATMSSKGLIEKTFLSFFNSVTARTAGFNISDLTIIGYPAVFLMIFLMWIGASPGSTGGGIKTTTFALALRSAWSNIRGRKVISVGNREINPGTLSRVLSILILSIIVIGTGFFFLLIAEPLKDPVHLLFESVSAFSTVGLSLADTSSFGSSGKVIVIILMFIGRVGPLTFLTGLFIHSRKRYYQYPSGDIAIN